MKILKVLSISALATGLLVGCGSPTEEKDEKEKVTEETAFALEISPEIKQELINAINENLKYAGTEEIEPYLATLNLSKEEYEVVKEGAQSLFDGADIDYFVSDIEVVSIEDGVAKVTLEQKSIATSLEEGVTFKDSLSNVMHTLVEVDGVWKIDASEVTYYEFLNEEETEEIEEGETTVGEEESVG